MTKPKILLFALGFVAVVGTSRVVSAFPVTNGMDGIELLGATDWQAGFDPYSDLFGAAEVAADTMFFPQGITYDKNNERIFVADGINHRVLVFDVNGGFDDGDAAAFVLGQPDFDTGGADIGNLYGNSDTLNSAEGCDTAINACGMNTPAGLHYDAGTDRLFVGDSYNYRVLVYELAGGIRNGMAASYVLGQPDFTTNVYNNTCLGAGEGTDACSLGVVFGIDHDPATNRLFVADAFSQRILVFDLDGLENGMEAAFVLGQKEFTTVDEDLACDGLSSGTTNQCGMKYVFYLDYDEDSAQLFASDAGNHRIMIFDLSSGIGNHQPAYAVIGQPNFGVGTTNTDCLGGASGDTNTNACGLGFTYGGAPEYDSTNQLLYVADSGNHRILVFDLSDGITNGQPASNVLRSISAEPAEDFELGGDPDADDFGMPATARNTFSLPAQVAWDPLLDRIFVVDAGNHRVVTFSANVLGEPVQIEGDDIVEVVTSEGVDDNGDPVTIIDIVEGDDWYTITLPEGTVGQGDDDITITAENQSDYSGVRISADLPAGTTKSIWLPKGTDNQVCIFDHRVDTYFGLYTCTPNGGDLVGLPKKGKCKTASVRGDLGDNPSDAGDADGYHSITVCLTKAGGDIFLDGLLHSVVQVSSKAPVDVPTIDSAGVGEEWDWPTDRVGRGDDYGVGCAVASRNHDAAPLALLLLMLLWRRRRR